MLSRSSISRNAPRALAAGRRAMASAANPTFQYDVSEASGVKVANREVGGATGTLALVAKAGSRYQPFPGFSDALEKFAFKVGPSVPRGHPLTIDIQFLFHTKRSVRFDRLHSSVPLCGSLVRSSCWAARSPLPTRAKTSSSAPSSSRVTFHTSQSSWLRLPARPSSLVSQFHLADQG